MLKIAYQIGYARALREHNIDPEKVAFFGLGAIGRTLGNYGKTLWSGLSGAGRMGQAGWGAAAHAPQGTGFFKSLGKGWDAAKQGFRRMAPAQQSAVKHVGLLGGAGALTLGGAGAAKGMSD